jgi:UDP-N-acetylmuramoyl-tripeptide--D-alanyl-D-alanine ligase
VHPDDRIYLDEQDDSMIEMRLADVAAVTGGHLHRATGEERVTAVEFDSRAIGPGGLFVTLPG